MKKVVLVLAVLFLASPAWAAVTISCSVDSNCVTVDYNNTEPNHVRGFGLDITVDNGAKITDVTSFVADYNIYPGSIDINSQSGDVDANGSPIADAVKYPNVTQPGVGFGGVTVEMGALYEGGPSSPNAPADSGTLFKVYVDKDCNVTVTDNVARGGIVMENPQASSNDNLDISCQVVLPVGCTYTGPDVLEWASIGSPQSWCNLRQCHGDADNDTETFGRGTVWVGMNDVAILLTGFRKDYTDPTTHPWISADFDHATEVFGRGTVRVGMADVGVLLYHFRDAHGVPPADCQTGSPVSP